METPPAPTTPSPHQGALVGDLLAVLRAAVGGLVLLWLPGAAAIHRVRGSWGTEGVLAAAAATTWLALTVASARRPGRWSPWARAPLALGLLLGGLAGYGAWLAAHHEQAAGPTMQEPLTGLPGNAIDEFGMRGKPHRDRPAGVPVVALVGCSMIYGAGVADDEAPSVRLEESLRRDKGLEARVFAFAIGMEAASSMTALVRQAIAGLRPDLVVVYAPAHHATAREGLEERVRRLGTDGLFRLFVAAHLELLYERVVGDPGPCPRGDVACQTLRSYDDLSDAARGARLMLVPDLRDASHFDRPFPGSVEDRALQRAVAGWFAAHPDVALFDASPDDAWAAAGTLPDHHWNAEGVRTTMGILARHVAARLRAPR